MKSVRLAWPSIVFLKLEYIIGTNGLLYFFQNTCNQKSIYKDLMNGYSTENITNKFDFKKVTKIVNDVLNLTHF
jgi:hypothetical protein